MNAITELEKRVLSMDSPCCACDKSDTCAKMCPWFKQWIGVKWPAIQSVLRKAGKEK